MIKPVPKTVSFPVDRPHIVERARAIAAHETATIGVTCPIWRAIDIAVIAEFNRRGLSLTDIPPVAKRGRGRPRHNPEVTP